MKKWFPILFFFLTGISFGQVFHFEDTSTTIIKTTAQSPAHWYIEIYNDLNIEDTLRWKTHFVNIPSAWSINFDVQSVYFNPVEDGDSADFVLMDSLDFPQKLIIGAHTNNTPGHGSVFFDIYDPQNPADVVTIEYEFIITTVGIEDELNEDLLKITADYIEFYTSVPAEYSIVSVTGKMVRTGSTLNGNCSIADLHSGIYFVYLQTGEKKRVKKFWK